tara:strand:+ start:111 stop:446 length:336 start_codon:yes stop_codon:yes gene_type:complete
MATYDDICEAAGVDITNCNSDMRAVITYMAQERPVLDQIPQSIKDEVHSWNGNLDVFEVYESIKDRPSRQIHQLLRYAAQTYQHHGVCGFSLQMFKELAWHFSVPLDNEDK